MLEAKRRADAAGVVLNMHHSYSPADTEADRRASAAPTRSSTSSDIGFLDRNITFGHANHLTDAECDAILETGPSLAWAPAASMMWGHGGSHPRPARARSGGAAAISRWAPTPPTGRTPSTSSARPTSPCSTARDAHGDRTFLLAEDGLRMATPRRRQGAGMEDRIGSLEVGKRADIVIHTLDRPEMIPATNMVRNLFYASGSKSVHTVIVNGRIVLEEGRFRRISTSARCSPRSTRRPLP